uniref:Uncharacterized protein n=1 Tax=viral metagenome TaxID=1070528 RepID=A0A6H2A1S5_9ZZZZ
MRRYISEKNKQKIRLYKQLHQKVKYREIMDYILPFLQKDGWTGKAPCKSTISEIINDKTPVEEKVLEKAQEGYIQAESAELIKITKNRLDHYNKAEALVVDKMIKKLNTDERMSSRELVGMAKDLTIIREKILGTIEIGIESEGDPNKIKRLELIEDLINDVESKTKITQKITAIRPDPVERSKTSSDDGEDERGEESSGEQD